MPVQSSIDWLDGFLFGVALVTSLHRQDTELNFAAVAVPPQTTARETVLYAHKHLVRPHLDQLSDEDIRRVPNGPRELMDVVEQWLIQRGPWSNDTATTPASSAMPAMPVQLQEKIGWVSSELYTGLMRCIGDDFEVYRYTVDKRIIREHRIPVVDQDRFLILGSSAAAIIILGETWQ